MVYNRERGADASEALQPGASSSTARGGLILRLFAACVAALHPLRKRHKEQWFIRHREDAHPRADARDTGRLVQPRTTARYQRIELADGTAIVGHDRSYLDKAVFERDISGKSLLDIGTFHGRFCIEALRRGAAQAIGLEPYAESIEVARQISAHAGLPAIYFESDFESWECCDRFDVVLCLNVLHHMLDPIHSIRRMMKMARERIVIEFAAPTLRDLRKYHVNPATLLGFRSSLVALGHGRRNTTAFDRTFLFTPDALRTIFNRHSGAFDPLEISRSPHKGRYVAIARKRCIEHLTVIAGPTSSGKTTLYRSLTAVLRFHLGIPNTDSARVTATEIDQLPAGRHRHVILHYDILRPFNKAIRTHERDIATDLIDVANRVTFLTIVASEKRIREQFEKAEIEPLAAASKMKRHHYIQRLYSDPNFLLLWYRCWLDYCARHSERATGHFIVENNGKYVFHPASMESVVAILRT